MIGFKCPKCGYEWDGVSYPDIVMLETTEVVYRLRGLDVGTGELVAAFDHTSDGDEDYKLWCNACHESTPLSASGYTLADFE